MGSEDEMITTNSKCICGNGDESKAQKNYFENKCPNCNKEGTLSTSTVHTNHQSNNEESDKDSNDSSSSVESDDVKIVCSNCGSEYCGQDGYDLSGGTRAVLNSINPNEVGSENDEVSTGEEEDTTYMSGWEGLCDLLKPLDAEAMMVQRGDYVVVKKIDMPQSAELWAYEGINIVDDSVKITDYTPEIYNTFLIKWGETFENELEFTITNHKRLFGERRMVLEAKKIVVKEDENSENNNEDDDSNSDNSESESSSNDGGIFSFIFGGGNDNTNVDTSDVDTGNVDASSVTDSGDDEEAPETEEVPITTKEEAIQFGMKQVGKAKREDGHTIELKVIGNLNWQMGEWCHVKIPSFGEDCYMFISKCSFESSGDNEYINTLTLVDYPPSLGKPSKQNEDENSEDEESEEENTDENATGTDENANGEGTGDTGDTGSTGTGTNG